MLTRKMSHSDLQFWLGTSMVICLESSLRDMDVQRAVTHSLAGADSSFSPMNLLFVPPFQCNAPLCSVFTHPIPKHTLFLILVSLVSSVLFPWLGSRAGFFRLVDDLYNTYRSAVGSRQTLLVPPTPPRPLPTKKLISPLCVGLGRRGVKYPPTPCPGGRGEHFYVINKTCFTEKKQTLLPL